MTTAIHHRTKPWRIVGWGLLTALLAVPAVAMRFTSDVNWSSLDFVAAGVMLGGLGLGFELVARTGSNLWSRCGMAIAIVAAFLLIWINLAVGIIGAEANDANLMFAGVLAVAVATTWHARLRPAGMAKAMVATAIAHMLVAAVALVGGLGADGPGWPYDVIGTTVMFDALWLLAAAAFRRAARIA